MARLTKSEVRSCFCNRDFEQPSKNPIANQGMVLDQVILITFKSKLKTNGSSRKIG
ncbi:MAG: hypothetical protein F6K24_35820 [Okeania sp. SIO2D1]|nr:hypothetical protein [Okeania sp. SIO2D1]